MIADRWKCVYEAILRLADNLRKYCEHLDQKSSQMKLAHEATAVNAEVWDLKGASCDTHSDARASGQVQNTVTGLDSC